MRTRTCSKKSLKFGLVRVFSLSKKNVNVPLDEKLLGFLSLLYFLYHFLLDISLLQKKPWTILKSDDQSTAKIILIILYILIETSSSIPYLFLSFLFSLVCLPTACLNSGTTGAASDNDLMK